MQHTKKIIRNAAVFIMAISFLMACQSADKNQNKSSEKTTANNSHHEHKSSETLSLNNGVKWKADSITNKNVAALKNIIANVKFTGLEDYHNTGQQLQVGINKMISECRMQGADHDALHRWLETLIETNKKLLESKTIDDAVEIFEIIKKQINLYSEFFE
jgi:hypothetical protein